MCFSVSVSVPVYVCVSLNFALYTAIAWQTLTTSFIQIYWRWIIRCPRCMQLKFLFWACFSRTWHTSFQPAREHTFQTFLYYWCVLWKWLKMRHRWGIWNHLSYIALKNVPMHDTCTRIRTYCAHTHDGRCPLFIIYVRMCICSCERLYIYTCIKGVNMG